MLISSAFYLANFLFLTSYMAGPLSYDEYLFENPKNSSPFGYEN